MSDTIRLNIKSGKAVARYGEKYLADVAEESPEEALNRQLNEQFFAGQQEGYKEAKLEFEKKYSETLLEKFEELHSIFSDFDERIKEYEDAFDKIVLELSLSVAEKIIKREVEKESIITGTLKECVKKVIGANNVIIKLNPDDLKMINTDSNNMFRDDSLSRIKFEADERVERGGCLVETDIGNVDGRISTQINEIRKKIEQADNLTANASS